MLGIPCARNDNVTRFWGINTQYIYHVSAMLQYLAQVNCVPKRNLLCSTNAVSAEGDPRIIQGMGFI